MLLRDNQTPHVTKLDGPASTSYRLQKQSQTPTFPALKASKIYRSTCEKRGCLVLMRLASQIGALARVRVSTLSRIPHHSRGNAIG